MAPNKLNQFHPGRFGVPIPGGRSLSVRRRILAPMVASIWILMACIWLVLEPRFSLRLPAMEIALSWVPIAVSIFLIGWVAIDAFGQLFKYGQHRVVLGDVVLLWMLFTIIFMQLSTHADALHFAHDFVAQPSDWLLFSLGNALRAADLADALKDYGVYVPQITPNSWLSCCLLIFYRSIIDILFLSYALLTVKQVGEWITKAIANTVSDVIDIHMIYLFCCITFVGCWAFTALWWSPWLVSDQILWPLDNLLRVIDIFDAMQIFGIRLDSVPRGPWEITLGVVLRFLIAIALASPISMLQDRSGKMFRTSVLQSGEESPLTARPTQPSESASDLRMAVIAAITFSLGMTLIAKYSAATHRQLVDAVVATRDAQAHRLIRRLGINCASDAKHALHEIAIDQTRKEDERLQATETLAYFGSESVDLVVDSLRRNPTLVARILDSLVRLGPSGSSVMVSVLSEEDLQMRRRALEQLKEWGGDAVSYLAADVDAANAIYYYTLFDQIDPYWDRRRGSGKWFGLLVDTKRSSRWLESSVQKLFSKGSLKRSRNLADDVGAIAAQMEWPPPVVAENLVRLEAFLRSANYSQIRKDWVQNDIRRRGRSGYVGDGAQYESDGVGQTKDHLLGLAKRHPTTTIDVFLKHQESDKRIYARAATECLRELLGPDYQQDIRRHQRLGIQQRVFRIDARPPGPAWAPPDVRQILIDSGLSQESHWRIPICPRDELTGEDARDILPMLRGRSDGVWKELLNELARVPYPTSFVEQLVAAAMQHPSVSVRLESTLFYQDLGGGDDLIAERLARETDTEVVAALLRAANYRGGLSEESRPLLETFYDSRSPEVADAVTTLLVRDGAQGVETLRTLAAENPLYAEQLLDRVESLGDFPSREGDYLAALHDCQPTETQISGLLRAIDRGWSGDPLRLLQAVWETGAVESRGKVLKRMLELGGDGQETYFRLLSQQTDPDLVEDCCLQIQSWLHRSYPALFPSDDPSPDGKEVSQQARQGEDVLQPTVEQIFALVSMPQPHVRCTALSLLGQLKTRYKRRFLTPVYARLGREADVQVRRAMIDFFAQVPPDGLKGIVSWLPRETDPELTRYVQDLIDVNQQELSRLAQQERERDRARRERVGELVERLAKAGEADVQNLQRELVSLGTLSLQPVARLLYEPDFDNRNAIRTGFAVLQSAGSNGLPILGVLAKSSNPLVWPKAVASIADCGPASEKELRALLKIPRTELRMAVLNELTRFGNLQDETLLEVAGLMLVEESGIDMVAYATLIKHPRSRRLLERASQSQNVRDSVRIAIERRLQSWDAAQD